MGQSDCTGTHGFCNTEDFISVLVFCHAFKSVVLHENSFFNLSLDVSVLPPSHLKVLLWYHDQWGWSQCFKLLITFWIRLWLIYSKKKKKIKFYFFNFLLGFKLLSFYVLWGLYSLLFKFDFIMCGFFCIFWNYQFSLFNILCFPFVKFTHV